MNNVSSLISIIIPVLNRSNLIGDTLTSVMNQTYSHWECLVIDDGSTDDTETEVQSYVLRDSRIQYHRRPIGHKPGGNGARNYGLTLAKGDYIQWFDSDDVMDSKLLEIQLQYLQQHQASYSICLYDVYNSDFTNVLKASKNQNIHEGIYYDYLTRRILANLQTILFTRQVLIGYGLKEHLLKAQEFDFLQRFFRDRTEGIMLNRVLVKVRRHAHSITENYNSRKLDSALGVSLNAFLELPSPTPSYVKLQVIKRYFEYLYISFKNGYTMVFYGYLLKLVYFGWLKSFLAIFYLGFLYPLNKLKLIPVWQFKRIYRLYWK